LVTSMIHKKPVHILARPGDISPLVVASGDPGRVKMLSSMLEDSILVNKNRGFLVYTGYWRDTRITVATHGIGGPSSGIVFEELKMLGAKVIVRLGTTGSLTPDLKVGDLLVVIGAAYPRGHLEMYVPDGYMAAIPDFEITSTLLDKAQEKKIHVKKGVVFSSDSFYAEDKDFVEKWSSRGVVGVEMECATLFVLGLIRGFKTGAILIVSNSLVEDFNICKDEMEVKVRKAAEVVFETLTTINRKLNYFIS